MIVKRRSTETPLPCWVSALDAGQEDAPAPIHHLDHATHLILAVDTQHQLQILVCDRCRPIVAGNAADLSSDSSKVTCPRCRRGSVAVAGTAHLPLHGIQDAADMTPIPKSISLRTIRFLFILFFATSPATG